MSDTRPIRKPPFAHVVADRRGSSRWRCRPSAPWSARTAARWLALYARNTAIEHDQHGHGADQDRVREDGLGSGRLIGRVYGCQEVVEELLRRGPRPRRCAARGCAGLRAVPPAWHCRRRGGEPLCGRGLGRGGRRAGSRRTARGAAQLARAGPWALLARRRAAGVGHAAFGFVGSVSLTPGWLGPSHE